MTLEEWRMRREEVEGTESHLNGETKFLRRKGECRGNKVALKWKEGVVLKTGMLKAVRGLCVFLFLGVHMRAGAALKGTSWKRDVASFVRDVLLSRFWRALNLQTLSPVFSKMHIVEITFWLQHFHNLSWPIPLKFIDLDFLQSQQQRVRAHDKFLTQETVSVEHSCLPWMLGNNWLPKSSCHFESGIMFFWWTNGLSKV